MPKERSNPDRAAWSRVQGSSLNALLKALVPHNSFYSQRLQTAGISSKSTSLQEFSTRVPFTNKHELFEDQGAHPPYGTNLTFPLERYTRFHQTSSTAGAPLRWLDTPESWSGLLDCWDRVYAAAGVGNTDRVFFAFSFGPFLGFWTAYESALRRGCLCLPGGGMSSAARLHMLLDHRVTVLCCTPTYALRLAEVAAQEALPLNASAVKTLVVAGEPGGSIPATRARIETAWNGAKVVDHHGMTEIGPVSYGCPVRSDVLHVIESAYFAEVVEPATGRAANSGETGELVLTTLLRTGSPLLRYRTGDLVKPAAPGRCACGTWELALEGGILGRSDDLVLVRGVNVYPSAVEAIVRSCAEVAEYRVEIGTVRQMAELRMEVEPVPGCPDPQALARLLEERLRAAFALRVPVKVVPAGTLPRFEMKARRWVRAAQ